MTALRRLVATATLAGVVLGQFVCDTPTNGCSNGMFNKQKCECECISPFCPDAGGDCSTPTDDCGGNPWVDCERGVDCPWWIHPMKAEACIPGPDIPLGLWNIYNTRIACCAANFPYSTTCNVVGVEVAPTKHPTIRAPDDDLYEIIPIMFEVFDVPDDIKMKELKEEMTVVLKRILLDLADRMPDLKVSSVEEKVVVNRQLLRTPRLLRDVSFYFNVYVVRDDDVRFGPIVINEIRENFNEVLDKIMQMADSKYLSSGNVKMNFCTSQNGKFDYCVEPKTLKPTLRPTRQPTPMPVPRTPPPVTISAPTKMAPTVSTVVEDEDDDKGGGGMPGWAVGLLVILLLLVLACVIYCVLVSCFTKSKTTEETHNNIYMNDRGFSVSGGSGQGRSTHSKSRDRNMYLEEDIGPEYDTRSRRSQRSRRTKSNDIDDVRSRRTKSNDIDDVEIVCNEPEDPQFDDDYFTVNTYGTRPNRKGRDPTMYAPGQEDLPDPDDEVQNSGRSARSARTRKYKEDPPLRPKRDPTMYFNGADEASGRPKRDPTMYVDDQEEPSEYFEGQRDPTMYAGGESYSHNSFGKGGPHDTESEYDQFGFRSGGVASEHDHAARDPTFYSNDDASFQTRERGESGGVESHINVSYYDEESYRSEKSKKKKSKKSSRK